MRNVSYNCERTLKGFFGKTCFNLENIITDTFFNFNKETFETIANIMIAR